MFTGSAQDKCWSLKDKRMWLGSFKCCCHCLATVALQYPIFISTSSKNGQHHASHSSFTHKSAEPFLVCFHHSSGTKRFPKEQRAFPSRQKAPMFLSAWNQAGAAKTYGHCVTEAGAGEEHRSQEQEQADSGTGGEEPGPARHCHQPEMQSKTNQIIIFFFPFSQVSGLFTRHFATQHGIGGCDMAGGSTPRGVSTRGSLLMGFVTGNAKHLILTPQGIISLLQNTKRPARLV